jgi:hypothetical protein
MNYSKFDTWPFCTISIIIIIILFIAQTLFQHANANDEDINEFTETYKKFHQHFAEFKHEALVLQANEDHDEGMLRILRHNLNEIQPFLEALVPVFGVTSKFYEYVRRWSEKCRELLSKIKVIF